MTGRAEFPKRVRSAALARSLGQCEASGTMYGLPDGERCGNQLNRGVQYDHIIVEFTSHDASLENCLAICIPCHRRKTGTHDAPLIAKTKAIYEKRMNLRKPQSRPMPCGRNSPLKKKMNGQVVSR